MLPDVDAEAEAAARSRLRTRASHGADIPDPLAEALAPAAGGRGAAAECAALMREFPGHVITWTPARGYRLEEPGRREPFYCQSKSALLCHLLQHRASA